MKKVKLNLVGQNYDAFNLMIKFSLAAQRAGWTRDEINSVLDTYIPDDYDNFLRTLMTHCEEQ